ncbi:MAG: hypothetical protein ACLFUJ_16165 [Phycisphaerae bacterium]
MCRKSVSLALIASCMLTGLLTAGCSQAGRPSSMGEVFMPTVYTIAGDSSSAATSMVYRKAVDRRTWLAAADGSRAAGRKMADASYGFFLLVSCIMPDLAGGASAEGYGGSWDD